MRRQSLCAAMSALGAAVLIGLTAVAAGAHCDTIDGPVVKAAQAALASGDVKLVLPWVQKSDEAAVQAAFKHTMDVRKLGPEARALADNYFFETLVRLHRAGEGAPYTGLKPAGEGAGPAVSAADKALETKDSTAMLALLGDTVRNGIQKHFEEVVALSNYKPGDVEAGRKFVAAYVEYVHYVEGIYSAATNPAGHHAEAGTEDSGEEDHE